MRAVDRTVDLVYFNAGGGHRASALALKAAIEAQALPLRVRLVNLREVLDPKASFRRLIGIHPEDFYNTRLARGWTIGLEQELKLLQGIVRWAHAPLMRALQRHWSATRPALVVSLIPNFNRALRESLAAAFPEVPYATLMTDLADLPPRFWIEKDLDQHLICGSPRAASQARAAGIPEGRIYSTSGMIIRRAFYELGATVRAEERHRLGLEGHPPTGLVLFGGHGSRSMIDIAKRLPATPLILACGHNEGLARALRALPSRAPRIVLGFIPELARYMAAADFFVGKPGPGSLSEAVQMQLPVIVAANRWTLPQERYNTEWVRERGVGLVIPGFSRVAGAVEGLTRDLREYKEATLRLRNRAAFEIPLILSDILSKSSTPSGAPPQRLGSVQY